MPNKRHLGISIIPGIYRFLLPACAVVALQIQCRPWARAMGTGGTSLEPRGRSIVYAGGLETWRAKQPKAGEAEAGRSCQRCPRSQPDQTRKAKAGRKSGLSACVHMVGVLGCLDLDSVASNTCPAAVRTIPSRRPLPVPFSPSHLPFQYPPPSRRPRTRLTAPIAALHSFHLRPFPKHTHLAFSSASSLR